MFESLFLFDTSFENLTLLVQEYQYGVVLLAPLFIGEIALFFFGILFGSGSMSLLAVLLGLGVVVLYDVIIFLLVRYVKGIRTLSFFTTLYTALPFLQTLRRKSDEYQQEYGDRTLLFICFLKILPLTKITIIFYALTSKTNIFSFVIKDIVATLFWASIVVIPGILVGREFFSYSDGQTLGTLFLVLIGFLIGMSLFEKYLLQGLQYMFRRLQKRSDV